MKNTLPWLVLLVLVSWPAAALDRVRLTTGEEVRGQLEVLAAGVFWHDGSGGKLFRWPTIDPESLPVDVRESVRQRVWQELLTADALYRQENIPAAQPLYARVYENRLYLTDEDRNRPEFSDVSYKMQGYVVADDGRLVSFAEYQKARGLSLYRGEWCTAAQIAMDKAFREALALARAAPDRDQEIVGLKRLLAQYPDRAHRQEVEGLIAQLRPPAPERETPAPSAAEDQTPGVTDFTSSMVVGVEGSSPGPGGGWFADDDRRHDQPPQHPGPGHGGGPPGHR